MKANLNRIVCLAVTIACAVALHNAHAQQPQLEFRETANGYQATTAEYESLMRQARQYQQQQQIQQNQLQAQQQMQQLGNNLGAALGNAIANSINNSKSFNNFTPQPQSPDLTKYNTPADLPQVIAPPPPDAAKVAEAERLAGMKTAGLLEHLGGSGNSDIDKWAEDILSGDTKKFTKAMFGNASLGQSQQQQTTQLPEYKSRQQALDDWNSFDATPKTVATQPTPKPLDSARQSKAADDWNNFDTSNTKPANGDTQTSGDWTEGGAPKWENPASTAEQRARSGELRTTELSKELDKEFYERMQNTKKEFYINQEKRSFPKTGDAK